MVQMTEPAALHCNFPTKLIILWRKGEHKWAHDFGILLKPRDTPLPGGRKIIEWIVLTSNRVDCPYSWPMQYQVPVTAFSWSGFEGLQHPLYQNQKFSLYITSSFYSLLLRSPVLSQLISTSKTWIQQFQFAKCTWGTFLVSGNIAVLALMSPYGTEAVVKSGGNCVKQNQSLPGCPAPCLSWDTSVAPLWTSTVAVA